MTGVQTCALPISLFGNCLGGVQGGCSSRVEVGLSHFAGLLDSFLHGFKSVVGSSYSAFESMQKAVKQASEMAETNFNTAAATALNATKTVAKKR